MDEMMETTRRIPIRRRKSKLQIFKESYLPYLILMAATIVILAMIIGALSQV